MNRISTICLPAFDGLELRRATLRNQAFPAHFHDHFSLTILEKGIERLRFGSLERDLPSGSTVVIAPAETHAHGPADGDEWAYRTLYLAPEAVNFLAKKANQTLRAEAEKAAPLGPAQTSDAAIFEAIRRFHDRPDEATEVVLSKIVARLAEGGLLRKRSDDAAFFAANADQIAKARARLEAAPADQKICLDELARAARMSKFHFLRTFRASTGLAPGAFQLFFRIQKAKKLLLEGRSASETALEAGFFDVSHFHRSFKKFIGVSPAEFKKGCGVV